MSTIGRQQVNDGTQSTALKRGGLGFIGGFVLCSVALVAQAALLHAITGSVRKTT